MPISAIKNERHSHNSKLPEFLIVIAFMVLYCAITAFHEPWYDEAQSWQIAKCESIGRLLFYIPHYEGNPPLWYLILAIPAKLGIPFEIGLKSIGFILCLCSVLILEFKSPFPRLMKLTLPFTYFFFYQYGVIVRLYCLVIMAFMLTGLTFHDKNTKPWHFVLCLAFLCESSSFCVVIAGGIALCWLLEILRELGFSFKNFFKDKRIKALCALLAFSVALVATILPSKDALFFNDYLPGQNSTLVCFLTTFFTVLAETLLTTSPWFSLDRANLAFARLTFGGMIHCIVIQLIIFVIIICFSSREKLKYFFIPYICFCLFGAIVLIGGHYLGIAWCFLLFWLWICFSDNRHFEIGEKLSDVLHISDRDKNLFVFFSKCICTLSIIVSLFWTISSSWKEIKLPYYFGRDTAHFLEDSGLEDTKIAAQWNTRISFLTNDKDKHRQAYKYKQEVNYEKMDLQSIEIGAILAAYADRNIIYNFNDGADNAAYVQYIEHTAEQNKETIERWKRVGTPDVLLGQVDVELLTDDQFTIKDYTPVFEMMSHYIWKGSVNISKQYVYVRNDLLKQYNITPLDRPEGMFGNTGFQITDEMREKYKNGEDVNEIVKPYLDYLFGEESGKNQ